MKIQKNNKIAGSLFMASGMAFSIAAAMMHQPAFYGIGSAFFVIGAAIFNKRNKDTSC